MVNNHKLDKQYTIGELSNWIYIYPKGDYILKYDNESASGITVDGYRVYCNSVQYTSQSGIDNLKFNFQNVLTLTFLEGKNHTYYDVIENLMTNDYLVIFEDKKKEKFVLNAEFNYNLTYNYNFNSSTNGNIATVTLTANQNVPTLKYIEGLSPSLTLRDDESCNYQGNGGSMTLQMMDIDKVGIIVDGDDFTIQEKEPNAIKSIEFLKDSLSFIDNYDGEKYTQTLTFQVPFSHYQYYFHYDLLKFMENRYYSIIETQNGNFIFGGHRQGLFPSYSVNTTEVSSSPNIIEITLTASYTTFNTLANDIYTEITVNGDYFVPIQGECIKGIYTYTLIRRYNSDGTSTNKYYCLDGYEEQYGSYNIVGVYYTRFDTSFGIKLFDANRSCNDGNCYIKGLPSAIAFKGKNQAMIIPKVEANCPVTLTYGSCCTARYDADKHSIAVVALEEKTTCNIIVSTGGKDYIINVLIGSTKKEDASQLIHTDAKEKTITLTIKDDSSNIDDFTSDIGFVPSNNTISISVPSNPSKEIKKQFEIVLNYKDGTKETITIIQDILYDLIIMTDGKACIDRDLYTLGQRFIGYSIDKIDIFDKSIPINLIEKDAFDCLGEIIDEEVIDTICYKGTLYEITKFTLSDETVVTKLVKTDEECTGEPQCQEYRINTGATACYDGFPHYKEVLYISNDCINFYPLWEVTKISDEINWDSDICSYADGELNTLPLYRWQDYGDTLCLADSYNQMNLNCMKYESVQYDESDDSTWTCYNRNKYSVRKQFISPLCKDDEWLFIGYDVDLENLIEEECSDCISNNNVKPRD